MLWIGLPQLFIFPIIPQLMKRFDLRVLVCFGAAIFAVSCFRNISMSPEYSGPQFFWPNIVRSLGQPFTIVPLSALATANLAQGESADGSAIFNIARNIGGSVGIALVSTVLTRREQFHDMRIGESISIYRLAVQQRLETIAATFAAKGFGPETAMQQAYASLKGIVRRDAYILATNSTFLMVGVLLFFGAAVVWVCKGTAAKADAGGH